jgi:hypothetical protein
MSATGVVSLSLGSNLTQPHLNKIKKKNTNGCDYSGMSRGAKLLVITYKTWHEIRRQMFKKTEKVTINYNIYRTVNNKGKVKFRQRVEA